MRRKTDKGFKAIICLAVATVAVGAASIAVSKMDRGAETPDAVVTPLPEGSEVAGNASLDLTGASAKIKEARLNDDGTYTVVVAEEGYIGEMLIEATYAADGQTLVAFNVLSHSETEGIGTLVNEDAYKAVLAGVKLPVTANGLDISAILGETESSAAQTVPAGALKDGIYKAQAPADDKGNYPFVSVVVTNGKITAVTWDEVYNGSLKSVLSTTGQYVMKPVWDTQAKSMCQYVVDNQGTAGLNLNESGKTDVVSGVSITVTGFTSLVEEALAKANGKDGVYEVAKPADEKGNFPFVSVTIKGGKITEVTWDEVYNGSFKSVLSTTGQYVMKPVWDTQAKSMSQYVVDNQGTAGLNLNEKGKTDVVSGVSITVTGFTGLVEECIAQASAGGLKDGVYKAQAPADDKGNYPFVSVTIEGGKIVAVTWDEVYNGSLKSELSTTGQYVMKPVWDTQAKSMCQYVVDNQGTAGLNLNESGKTDVVSGVSITVTGFTSLVEEALAKANGKDGVYEVQAPADDKGNYPFVSVTIKDGKITEVTWDEVYNGSLKSVLSTTGKYVMKPVWDTQAKSMCQYVVDNQTTAGLNLNEKGKTDVVSGVSITVTGFTGLVEEALKQASGSDYVPAVPATPAVEATKVDVVSGATFSSRAVLRAINEGFVYLRDCVFNK